MTILKQIGSNIRKLRLKANLSQEQLAELASLHRTYIGAVERGERNVSAVNIGRIAKALRVSPHVLLMEHSDVT
jgi:transcriptional regulator with XRE-family HTH domain